MEERFNPNRLALARRRRGFTKVALGKKVGLSARRIAALENEGENPSPNTVTLLAKVLGFPEDFFFRGDPVDLGEEGVSFRSYSRLSATHRDAALAAAAMAVEVAAWVSERFKLPAADLPDLRDVDPTTAASLVRTAWSLGNDPAPNMIHLLEAHGVRVFSLVDDCAKLDAFSLWCAGQPFIFLTQHKSPERNRWDAAHELAHLVLHLDGPPQGREQEREADAFTAEFLLPEKGVRATAAPFPSLPEVCREKFWWRVSAIAYIRRLHQLGIITDWQYRSLAIEASQGGLRRGEGDIDHETSQVIEKVLAMLRQDGVSLAQVAQQVGMKPHDLRGLLFSSLSVIEGERPQDTSADRAPLRVINSPG